jgi:hypothetical protein
MLRPLEGGLQFVVLVVKARDTGVGVNGVLKTAAAWSKIASLINVIQLEIEAG